MCSVSRCYENMRGTNLSLCKQEEAQGLWLMSRGTSEYGSACTCERVHTSKCMKHYTLLCFFPLTWQWDGALKFTCNKSWVLYVFVFTSLVMAKIKSKWNKSKIKTENIQKYTTKYCTLQMGNIYFQFCWLFVTSMWHHYPFCWCVEVRLWVPGSGPARSCKLHSIPYNTQPLQKS